MLISILIFILVFSFLAYHVFLLPTAKRVRRERVVTPHEYTGPIFNRHGRPVI